MLEDPRFWVMVAFFGFLAAFGRKLWALTTRGLDSRSDTIRNELDEARRLREEAQTLLAAYREKHAQSMKEAEEILARARTDAERLAANANTELKRLLDVRTRMAEDKIARAEKQAIAEVQNHVVDITVAAARAIVTETIRQTPADPLVGRAIAEIGR